MDDKNDWSQHVEVQYGISLWNIYFPIIQVLTFVVIISIFVECMTVLAVF